MIRIALTLTLGFFWSFTIYGQSVARQTIQVTGKSIQSGSSVMLQSSTGQPSPTQNRQGFIQPPYFVQTKGINLLKAYPSPTLGLCTVEFEFEYEDQLQVIDMNGRPVFILTIQKTEARSVIDLSEFSSGKYILRIVRRGESVAEGNLLKMN